MCPMSKPSWRQGQSEAGSRSKMAVEGNYSRVSNNPPKYPQLNLQCICWEKENFNM